MEDIKRLFYRVVREAIHNEGKRAVLGNSAGAVFYTGGQVYKDWVHITYLDGEGNIGTQEAVVRNGGVPQAVGFPVRVVERNGVTYAIPDKFGGRISVYTDGGQFSVVEPHGQTHRRLGIDPRYVEGLAFEPLMVRPSDPVALTVYVEAGWYIYGGTSVFWPGGTSGSLSSYVPASDDSSINYIVICIDVTGNTIAVYNAGTVTQTDQLFQSVVTATEVAAITPPTTYLPLAVVELDYGQTTILPTHITWDMRPWIGLGTSSSFGLDVDKIITDADGNVIADADGNLLVSA